VHPKSKPELSCAKKETRTTKVKKKKEHAEIGFQDLGSHFFKSLQSLEILEKKNHSTTNKNPQKKKLLSISTYKAETQNNEHEPNLTLSFERRNTPSTVSQKSAKENQKKSAEAKKQSKWGTHLEGLVRVVLLCSCDGAKRRHVLSPSHLQVGPRVP
jgi:hypothetical protein